MRVCAVACVLKLPKDDSVVAGEFRTKLPMKLNTTSFATSSCMFMPMMGPEHVMLLLVTLKVEGAVNFSIELTDVYASITPNTRAWSVVMYVFVS